MPNFRVELAGGALVGVRREGTGTPLVLAHGFGGSRHDWEPVIAALPPDLPLIAYDARGFGESPGEPGVPFSHADDLLALLDALDVERADLCGISMGGGNVLHFALDHPERVRRLVLVSPLMLGWSWSSDWIDRWKTMGRAARAEDFGTARDLWWHHPLFDSTREVPEAAAHLRQSIAAFPGRQWAQDDQRPELPEVDRLTSLSVPTLLLTGARDTEDFRLISDLIAATGRDVTRIDHADAGHLLNLEIPATLAGEIVEFLA
ncbi:2-succinyl-6-hydroxy-2,4-cyclohexadiene-1-carboxylate synthase [Novosphingobium sp. PhB165]|uniref:alpha/beta fold hydrolase n=1 Tax=Novosphingobium sp. PhB165 TaxID=2485105 RepID=UPI001043101D|nr:alpha/beta fold hydrolase [Novosphingobium sp. PhB165]TCM15010.1 2-succinyl-6-hydroxy-2,4-cyclohexadiene-1-carboxylate synthase [Novosphingobium sp. PhB165]